MTKEELLKAFTGLSPDDQEAIRRELGAARAPQGPSPACIPEPMKQHMMEMMKKLEGTNDPMSCCREMIGMCQDMMKRFAAQAKP